MTKNALVMFILATFLFVLATVGAVFFAATAKKSQEGADIAIVLIVLIVIVGSFAAAWVGIRLILPLILPDHQIPVRQVVSRPKVVSQQPPKAEVTRPVVASRPGIFRHLVNEIVDGLYQMWIWDDGDLRILLVMLAVVISVVLIGTCGCAAPQIAPVQMHQTIEGLMRMGEKRGEDRVFFFNRGETEYYCTYTAKPACLECRVYTRNDYRNGIIVHDDGADGVVDAGEVEEAGVKLDEFYRQRVWGGYVAEKGVEFESRYREVYGEIIRTLIRHLLKASPPDKPPEKKTATSVKRPKMAMVGKTNKR